MWRIFVSRYYGNVGVRHIKFQSLLRRAMVAKRYDRAEKLAYDWLQFAEERKDEQPYEGLYYGEVIHYGHAALGLIYLRRGDISVAKQLLLESGKTPGSPRLDSYGPSMKLARELLEKGEKTVVTEYLILVARFWAPAKSENRKFKDSKSHKEFTDYQRGKKTLIKQWKADVQKGRVPNHEMWR